MRFDIEKHWWILLLIVIGLILLYRYFFTIPKVYIKDIIGNKIVTYKVGKFGKERQIQVSELPMSAYTDEHGNASKGYEQKIRNGILRIYYHPTEKSIKFETHNADDTMFVRWAMAYLNDCHWEDSEDNNSKPKINC